MTKILLIDKNVGDAELLRAGLSDVIADGFAFDLAHVVTLEDGLCCLSEADFDVVLLDLFLPDSHGLATITRVREALPAMPIVVLTGLSDETVAMESMREGAQDYLVKGQVDGAMLARAMRYAIERKRIEAQLQQQRERRAALHEINAAITSTLDLQSVLRILLEKIHYIFPKLATTVRIVNTRTGDMEPLASLNLDESHWKRTATSNPGKIIEFIMATKKPLAIPDLQHSDLHARMDFVRENGLVSYLGVPLLIEDQILGLLSFYARERHEFSEDEIDFFNTLGGQAAVALRNSQLYQTVKRANQRQAILNDINVASTSTLSFQSVINILLEKIVGAFPDYAATIRLVDRDSGHLGTLACRNVDEGAWKEVLPSGPRGLAKLVIDAGTPVAIADIQNDSRTSRPDFLRKNGLVSYLGVPLIIKDEPLGVLNLYTKERHEFSDDEIAFFNTLARQAAVALHNSRLYEEIKSASERQTALHDINLAITSTLDLNSVLEVFLAKVARLVPNFAVTARLLNPETDILEPLACRNVDETKWKNTVPSNRAGRAKEVMASGRPVVIEDAQNDPRTSNPEFVRREGLVSYVGVPLVAQDKSFGVIGFYTRERHRFSQGEVEFLATLAAQAAIAIHNSRLYERLKTSNQTLEKTLEIKSALVAVMAHELKNPIQVIMGSSSLLAGNVFGELTKEQRDRVRNIQASTEELIQLIDGALEMARVERGKMALEATAICVAAFLTDLKAEFEPAFQKQGVKLDIDVPPASATIITDRLKLKEILRNLVDNARKFTPGGQVSVKFENTARDRVAFVVSDTGVGIPSELLANVFELFYQVNPSQPANTGAGLGLNIVKRLVGAISGKITVASEAGKGTTFRVELPTDIV